MPSKEVADLTHRVLDGTEELHLVAGVVRDGGGHVTNHGNSRRATLGEVLAYVTANIPAGGISQAFADGRYLQKASNLSDVASASSARTNLGLGSAATFASSAFLQTANNLSDIGNLVTARTNLQVYSKAEVDAAIAANSGGPWYKGFTPVAANFPTLFKATGTTNNLTLTDDANVGLMFDSVDMGQAATDNIKTACQLLPATDAADWTVTTHIQPGLMSVANIIAGLVLVESAGGGGWPLVIFYGPTLTTGNFLTVRGVLAGGGFSSQSSSYNLSDINNQIWLRIRWVAASAKYFFDVSQDGKAWRNWDSRTKAQLSFTARANYVGFGFWQNGVNAQPASLQMSCDYFRRT